MDSSKLSGVSFHWWMVGGLVCYILVSNNLITMTSLAITAVLAIIAAALFEGKIM